MAGLRRKLPCQISAAIDGPLALGGILRSRTICDLVRESEVDFFEDSELSEWGLTAWGSYGDLSVKDVLAVYMLYVKTWYLRHNVA